MASVVYVDMALNEFSAITSDVVSDLGSPSSCRGRPPTCPVIFLALPCLSFHHLFILSRFLVVARAKSARLFQIPGRTARFVGPVPGLMNGVGFARIDGEGVLSGKD